MTVFPTPGQQEYGHDNSTEGRPGKLALSDWLGILSLVIALVGLVGNGLVLWLLGFYIPRNPFAVYILNLAGANALYLCCHFVFSIDNFIGYLTHSFMFKVMAYISYMLYMMGVSLLAVISTERCLSVLFPIWSRCHRPKNTSTKVCTVLWGLVALFGVAEFFVCHEKSPSFCLHFFIVLLVWIIFLMCVLCVSSFTLLLGIHCSPQGRQLPRLSLLVLLTVLVFLLFGLTPVIMDFLEKVPKIVGPFWISKLLACVNSSANPFVYFFLGSFRHRRRREPLRMILQRVLEEERELRSGSRNTLHTDTSTRSF